MKGGGNEEINGFRRRIERSGGILTRVLTDKERCDLYTLAAAGIATLERGTNGDEIAVITES